ncbi:putative uncharacterized protein [Methylocaldum marinum]|uniref:Uncharacterized protein n=1 Tax=Methylocaldum marinum TaxID=1432792 RepID=A0A286P3P0_9GAMM|nr:hypothetical protein [Methylocaldum marinum]BBA32262.1 putative uncharacterized protein [Methylocaldum marinum]
MKLLSRVLLTAIALSALHTARAEDEWHATTLSDRTLEKVKLGLVAYQSCVNDETRSHIGEEADSRALTDRVLKTCEGKLSKVKAAFDSENVPGTISERYMRGRRTQAARQVLRALMGSQAAQTVTGRP